jgi:hypothetical protein
MLQAYTLFAVMLLKAAMEIVSKFGKPVSSLQVQTSRQPISHALPFENTNRKQQEAAGQQKRHTACPRPGPRTSLWVG